MYLECIDEESKIGHKPFTHSMPVTQSHATVLAYAA
jgi:hypothetical protein